MSLLTVMLFGWTFGCSSAKSGADAEGADESDAANAPVESLDEDGTGSEEEPVSWDLIGTLVVSDQFGNLSAEESALVVRLRDALGGVLCEDDVVLGDAIGKSQTHYPDDALLSWWELHVDSPDPSSCFGSDYDFPVPSVLMVGIGDMDPELRAVAGASPDTLDMDTLNGVYASVDRGDTVWVFGVAAAQDTVAEEGSPVAEWPVPEGTWDIDPLYPFPL